MKRPPWLQRIEDGYDSYLDTDWATTTELRGDGAAQVVILTVDRVEALAFDYYATGRTLSWSIPRPKDLP